jgi:hypothetical protein
MHFSKKESAALAAFLLVLPAFGSPIPERGHKSYNLVNHASTAVQVGSAANDVISTGTTLRDAGKSTFDDVFHKNQQRTASRSHSHTTVKPAHEAPKAPAKEPAKEPAKTTPVNPEPAKPEHAKTEPAKSEPEKTSKIDKIVNGANTAAQVGSAANDLVSTGDSLYNSAKGAWNDVFHHGQGSQSSQDATAASYCK